MNATAERLHSVIETWTPRLEALDDGAAASAPAPGKWCPKEVVGHLVDSASVNLERFLRARGTDDLLLPGYPGDEWVEAQGYREMPWRELIGLWRALNLHVARIMERTPAEALDLPRRRHALDAIAFRTVPADEPTTLAYLMVDYVDHLEHHLAALG